MIPQQTFENYPVFGNNSTKVKPDDTKYANGWQQADVVPAEWLNWFFAKNSQGITDLNQGVTNVEQELLHVVTEGGLTPAETTQNQVFQAIRAFINGARQTVVITTAVSTLPAKTGVALIPALYDGLKLTLKFTNGYYDADSNGFSFNLNGLGAKKIYANKHGELTEMTSHSLDRDGITRAWYVQPLTTLDVTYDATADNGNGGWVVDGNPVVLSSDNYTIYADGYHKETLYTQSSQTYFDIPFQHLPKVTYSFYGNLGGVPQGMNTIYNWEKTYIGFHGEIMNYTSGIFIFAEGY